MRLSNKRGDSILEVALAIAILATVLAGSYSIARRSLRIGQESQDRIQAAKYLEGQSERFRNLRDVDPAAFSALAAGNRYCFTSGVAPIVATGDLAACSFGPVGDTSRYRVYFEKDAGVSQAYTFSATWQTASGQDSRIEYRYRIW